MLKKARVLVIAPLLLALASLVASPAMAQSTTDALDQSFTAQNADGSALAGSVQIPTLTPASAVTGGGTMVIEFAGQTYYSGPFTATTLKSITPPSASLSPLVLVTPSSAVTYYGSAPFQGPTITNGPIVTNGLIATVQLAGQCASTVGSTCVTASPTPTADLFLYCANAKATLDIGITLGSPASNTANLGLLAIPNQAVAETFLAVTGTTSGSLC